MTKYREILRLCSQEISQRSITLSCECSRNTVAKIVAKAKELDVKWPLSSDITDAELENCFFLKNQHQNRFVSILTTIILVRK